MCSSFAPPRPLQWVELHSSGASSSTFTDSAIAWITVIDSCGKKVCREENSVERWLTMVSVAVEVLDAVADLQCHGNPHGQGITGCREPARWLL